MQACVAASLDGASSPSTSIPCRSHTTTAAGVSSSYGTPLALMTIRSSSGTRADRLPLVHATRPLRASSACRGPTSRRSAAVASVMDHLPRPDLAQLVHDLVAAAAEVVVQAHVALVEHVVGVAARRVRDVGIARDAAHHLGGGDDVRVGAGRH